MGNERETGGKREGTAKVSDQREVPDGNVAPSLPTPCDSPVLSSAPSWDVAEDRTPCCARGGPRLAVESSTGSAALRRPLVACAWRWAEEPGSCPSTCFHKQSLRIDLEVPSSWRSAGELACPQVWLKYRSKLSPSPSHIYLSLYRGEHRKTERIKAKLRLVEKGWHCSPLS